MSSSFQGAQGSSGSQPQDHTHFDGTGEEQTVVDPLFGQRDPRGTKGVRRVQEARKMAGVQEGDWEGLLLSALPLKLLFVSKLTHFVATLGDKKKWYLLGDLHTCHTVNGTT